MLWGGLEECVTITVRACVHPCGSGPSARGTEYVQPKSSPPERTDMLQTWKFATEAASWLVPLCLVLSLQSLAGLGIAAGDEPGAASLYLKHEPSSPGPATAMM